MESKRRVEGRNVTMYPEEWEIVDQEAQRRGFVTARGPNTSLTLRRIVREFAETEDGAVVESCEPSSS